MQVTNCKSEHVDIWVLANNEINPVYATSGVTVTRYYKIFKVLKVQHLNSEFNLLFLLYGLQTSLNVCKSNLFPNNLFNYLATKSSFLQILFLSLASKYLS